MTKRTAMRSYIATTIAALALSGGMSALTFTSAHAAEPVATAAMTDAAQSGTFTKRTYKIKGDWQILKQDGQTLLRLSDTFKTKNGPDLKLFLSPNKLTDVTGKSATTNAVRLGVLKSSKGTQDYVIPADIDLSQFGSVLIHCEAYSKLWGGADI